jgi:biotin-dependent carboxylase-like uncharacterized protein
MGGYSPAPAADRNGDRLNRTIQSAAGIEILATGPLALLQDRGRPGYAHLGVSRSGAADRSSYLAANRLVGNRGTGSGTGSGAAAVEVLAGGLLVRSRGSLTVAVGGPETQLVVVMGGLERHEPSGTTILLRDGDTLGIGMPPVGLRSYLAVRGGLAGRPALGSISFDTLSAIGPAPLQAGDFIPIGSDAGDWPAATVIPPTLTEWFARTVALADPAPIDIPIIWGPREDWFTADAIDSLRNGVWAVSTASDRIGIHLELPAGRSVARPLARLVEGELQSEGMVPGAIQVPANGLPIVFLRDHPVTGGYPVVAVVTEVGLDRLAQCAPGTLVRLRAISGRVS